MKTKVQQYVDGVGGVRMWGFCPAIDLLEAVPDGAAGAGGGDADAPINICSLMAGDISSCLKTMAQMRRRAAARPVNLYMVEKHPEVLARHILLLAIFFDEDLGPRECTEIFLEVYGNAMLRKQTSTYVHNKVEELVSFLTNGTGVLAGLIDVTSLKFKERDAIEKVFKTWLEDVECDMLAWREKRLRQYYEDRYDYRKNLIDWDYSMSVKEWAEIIHSKLFLWWRQEGTAFEVRDAKMPQPNRSLASYAEGREKGYSKLKRGYWGDVVQSPYWALGVQADEPRLFKKRSMQHVKTCQHVAEYNVYGMLHEIATGEKFKMPDADDEIYGRSFWSGLSHKDTTEKIEEIAEEESESDRLDTLGSSGGRKAKVPPPGFKIHLLQLEEVSQLYGKKKFGNLFHLMLISNQATHSLKADLNTLLTDNAAVVCEGADFMLNLNKDDRATFNSRLVELGRELGCVHDASKRDSRKLYNDKLVPLYFLDFDRAGAGPIMAEAAEKKAAREKAREEEGKQAKGEKTSGGSMEETLGNGTSDDRPSLEAMEALQSEEVPLIRGTQEGAAEAEAARKVRPGPFGICSITGLPAKYKDPVTGLGYANVAAFKELRRVHAGEEPSAVKGSDASSEACHVPAPSGPVSHSDALAHLSLKEKGGEDEPPAQGDGEEEEVEEPLMCQKKARSWGLGGAAVL